MKDLSFNNLTDLALDFKLFGFSENEEHLVYFFIKHLCQIRCFICKPMFGERFSQIFNALSSNTGNKLISLDISHFHMHEDELSPLTNFFTGNNCHVKYFNLSYISFDDPGWFDSIICALPNMQNQLRILDISYTSCPYTYQHLLDSGKFYNFLKDPNCRLESLIIGNNLRLRDVINIMDAIAENPNFSSFTLQITPAISEDYANNLRLQEPKRMTHLINVLKKLNSKLNSDQNLELDPIERQIKVIVPSSLQAKFNEELLSEVKKNEMDRHHTLKRLLTGKF